MWPFTAYEILNFSSVSRRVQLLTHGSGLIFGADEQRAFQKGGFNSNPIYGCKDTFCVLLNVVVWAWKVWDWHYSGETFTVEQPRKGLHFEKSWASSTLRLRTENTPPPLPMKVHVVTKISIQDNKIFFSWPTKSAFCCWKILFGGWLESFGPTCRVGFWVKGGIRGFLPLGWGGVWGLVLYIGWWTSFPLPSQASPQPTWFFSLSFVLISCFRLSSCWVPISFPTPTSSTMPLSFPQMLKHLFTSLIFLPSVSFGHLPNLSDLCPLHQWIFALSKLIMAMRC